MILLLHIIVVLCLNVVGQRVVIDKQVSGFGQTLRLLCTFKNFCNRAVVWEVWNPDSVTLNVKNFSIDPKAKYSSETTFKGYILNIRNLSKYDLDKNYTCNCKFTRSNKIFLVEPVVFKNETNETSPDENSKTTLDYAKIIAPIVSGFVILVFTLWLVYLWKRRNRNDSMGLPQTEDIAEDVELNKYRDTIDHRLTMETLGFIPSAIQQMGDQKIEEYKKILKAGKEKRYFVKMFFLGKNGVGKTSLMRRLLKEEITDVESTHGLDIVRSCKISVPDGEWIFNLGKIEKSPGKIYADCVMVDFAGEKDYYITHQTFLTVNAVFLLTVSLLDDNIFDDNIPDEEKINFWLDNIHCYATKREIYVEQAAIQENQIPANDKENKLDPPVIVVCTNATEDDPSVTENRKLDIKAKKKTFFKELCKVGKLNNRIDHFCGNIQYLSNKSDKNDNFQELRKLIYRSASTLSDWGKEVPTRWVDFEKELNKQRNEQKRILEIGTIKEIAKGISSDFTDNEIIFFLNYQHFSGNLIFFEDIKDLIILDPKWLIDVFKCLVCAEKFQNKVEHGCIWANLEETGEIKETDIKLLLSSISETFDISFILEVMEKFDIIVQDIQKDSLYVIPSMIKRQIPEPFEYEKLYSKGKSSSWLCLTFDFLPPALFNHLIVCFMRDAKFEREELFHGMCVFNRQDTNKMEKLIICKFSNTIQFQYVLLDKEDLFSSWSVSKNAKYVLENVNTTVKYFTSGARYGMTINYSKKIMCCFHFDSSKHAVEIEQLKQKKKFYCRHKADSETHDSSDEIYTFWTKSVEMFDVVAIGEDTIQGIERSMKRFKEHMPYKGEDKITSHIRRMTECLTEEKRRTDILQFTNNINDIVKTTAELQSEAKKIFLKAYTRKLRNSVKIAKELLQSREIRMLRAIADSDKCQTLQRQIKELTELIDKCKDITPEKIEQATEELREMINQCNEKYPALETQIETSTI